MYLYLAKIIFRIITGEDVGSIGLFEEKFHLIHGKNDRDALYRASAWGEKETSEFINPAEQETRWEFIAVSELRRIPSFIHRIRPDSHLKEMPAEEFIALQKDRHQRLLYTIEGTFGDPFEGLNRKRENKYGSPAIVSAIPQD